MNRYVESMLTENDKFKSLAAKTIAVTLLSLKFPREQMAFGYGYFWLSGISYVISLPKKT